jgi:exo-beta-1,3-glucanase (GH17 family)
MRPGLVLAAGMAALAAFAAWFWFDRPVPVSESWSGSFASASFAPYSRYQNPINDDIPTEAQIASDLKALQGKVLSVRTYSLRDGLDAVPKLAQPLRISVTLGAWLGDIRDPQNVAKNEEEIAALIRVANAYPDTVKRVIVGNEVLLRRDLTPAQLIAYIRRVKAAIRQPVSYADVWVFFLKYPEVVPELDYLTIHVLPYWEDEPVPLDHLEAHVMRAVGAVGKAFPDKSILIGETGWPSLGRDRGPAVVSTVNQARYLRQIAHIATRNHLDYNIVEAFDQPWKSLFENTVGASWGILDADRQPKFAMSGPVTEVRDWPLRAAIAIAFGLTATLAAGRRLSGFAAALTLALLAQMLAWLTVTTGFHVALVSFRWWQFLWAPFRVIPPALFGIVVLERAAGMLALPARASEPERSGGSWLGEVLILFFALYALIWTLLLAVDGRYRDIPEVDFALPCVGTVALVLLRAALARRRGGPIWPALNIDALFPAAGGWLARPGRRDRLVACLGAALVMAAAAALIGEGFAVVGEDFLRDHRSFAARAPLVLWAMLSNREMLLWSAMQLVLAVPFLVSWGLQQRA